MDLCTDSRQEILSVDRELILGHRAGENLIIVECVSVGSFVKPKDAIEFNYTLGMPSLWAFSRSLLNLCFGHVSH